MQNITLHSHVGADDMLRLNLPVIAFNTDVKIKLTVKPINIIKPFPTTRLEDGLGCLKYQGKAKYLEEIEQGIIKSARKQWFNEEKR